ncbi:putative bifunctional diguanylate cyclase/phosphodiesterase [Oharaeibacter diazotrophicus]|uniref:Diguanylate cyclase (GGDEF)-like protein n=1 Tax=Oharaeibacter diazotrophicus TaxID=1920512 RepID=A0A4R6R9F1_9HYPH|nr:EAL domain-containing protein [Oharaeibacter diazotrophicus]TDP82609.1 diguanylate cyclase (GGDEF)-like protein [Oharaeibacter diazotrophicus]BBE72627.1 cyclic di-GMP phosphodiesterase Gmr [Pleomorphomonas sp. SM30]GLS76661.1 hypothetical protein GCM10007904_19980 [Oharaeibacter diazotrophicus]
MPDLRTHDLLRLQTDVLKAVALDAGLAEVADLICRRAEAMAPGATCSVVLIDETARIRPLAGPSLPPAYCEAIDGLEIGPEVGSCGTAAHRGTEVIVTDIEHDPLWASFKELALGFGLRACWSSPIKDETGGVVATFAFYYGECRGPTTLERRIVETCIDLCAIAIRHHAVQTRISRLAYTDTMTQLPNRVAFEDFATAALVRGGVGTVGIHYIDLDDFKTVNDTLGHRVGDELLAAVAQRIAAAVPAGALVARLGGDEFAICCPAESMAAQESVAVAVLAAFRQPFAVGEHMLACGVSVGVAVATSAGGDLEVLSQRADTALYSAKAAGRNTYRFFSDEMADAVQRRSALRADLAQALAGGQFHLVYQPLVQMDTQAVTGFEALLRWTHPVHGAIPPDRFVPLAEEMGAIVEIGHWVLDHALADAATWPPSIGLSVNVSPIQLEDPGFAAAVTLALLRHGVRPSRLAVEVTETALFESGGTTRRTLDDLKALGVGIVLDDFGTGYSSLSLIRDRRFSKLKIDKSFVDGLGVDPDCNAIVRGTLGVARATGFRTTAEGIETAAQLAWLRDNGCDEGQGFLIARPMRPDAVADFLAARASGAVLRRA